MTARWLMAALLLVACDGAGGPYCDGAALQAALDAAEAGAEIQVGECRVERALRVPPGVTLRGQGEGSVIAPAAGSANTAIYLEPGEPPARVEDLVVESDLVAGVGTASPDGCDALRPGRVAIERVQVRASRGWGVYLECLDGADLTDVTVEGPVRDTNHMSTIFTNVVGEPPASGAACSFMPSGSCTVGETREMTPADCPECGVVTQVCDPCERWASVTATDGLALRDVGDAALAEVWVRGFARVGVTVVGSQLRWTGGGVEEQLALGVYGTGSELDLEALAVRRVFESPWRLDPGVGIVATDGSVLRTVDVEVEGNPRYGILQVRSTGSHVGLLAHDNDDAAIWVGEADSLEITGAELSNNAFAGVVMSGCSNVVVRDSMVTGTRVRVSSLASGTETGRVEAGDGLQMIATTSNVSVASTVLADNERAGLVLDLAAGVEGPTFSEVTVRGMGEQLGAIAGAASGTQLSPVAPDGVWDMGITREGATAVNDAALATSVDVSAVVAPTNLGDPGGARGVVAPTN